MTGQALPGGPAGPGTAAGPSVSAARSPQRTPGHVGARLDPRALAEARRALANYRVVHEYLGAETMLLRQAADAVVDGLAVLLGSIEPPGGER